jgi:hypothetical protein
MRNKKFWEELIACFPSILHGPHRHARNGVEKHRQESLLKNILTRIKGDTYIRYIRQRETSYPKKMGLDKEIGGHAQDIQTKTYTQKKGALKNIHFLFSKIC